MTTITVAATQMSCTWDIQANIEKAEHLVHQAAQQGAQIILLQELFETPYFCIDQKKEYFSLARPVTQNPLLAHFSQLAAKLRVVIPLSFFEQADNAYFNSVMVIDADGSQLGVYRKTHIPSGPGYQEKFYFSPGNTGFKVWHTQYAKLGIGICWDQWFPEAARIMALEGADLLLYPSAIGSEPENNALNTSEHWQRTMQGHASANIVPVVASNRVGQEQGEEYQLTFYGSSFITDPTGKIIAQAGTTEETCIIASFDLQKNRALQTWWGFFQDRQLKQYRSLLTRSEARSEDRDI